MTNAQKVEPNAPLQEGEFRRIKGIAETTERALHDAGIETFDHLAMLTPADIAAALPGSVGVKERAARQDWASQAASLASLLAERRQLLAERRQPEEAPAGAEELGQHQQHYASFMVVLLLDEEQQVRRTTVTHIQDDMRESWAGWEPQRMASWVAEQAGISSRSASAQVAEETEPQPEPVQPQPVQRAASKLDGTLMFGPVQWLGAVSKRPRTELHAGKPFIAALTLDLSQVSAAPDQPLAYRAEAHIRRLGEWDHTASFHLEGEISPGENGRLEFLLPGLLEGAYHLDIAVLVAPKDSTNPAEEGLSALTEGLLIRVQAEEAVRLPG